MKREKRLLVVLLCGCLLMCMLGFSACGSSQEASTEVETEETKVLTAEELMDIAFADAGFGMSAASDIKVGLSKDGIRTVTFNIQDAAYSYDINETTGEIVNSTKPDVAPDVDVDPAGLAIDKLAAEAPEFMGASNINTKDEIVDGKKVITITFDNAGKSYKYIYDVESGKLEKK